MRAMDARESADSPSRLDTGTIPMYSIVQYDTVVDMDQEVNAYMAHSQLYVPGYVDPTDSDFPVALLRSESDGSANDHGLHCRSCVFMRLPTGSE